MYAWSLVSIFLGTKLRKRLLVGFTFKLHRSRDWQLEPVNISFLSKDVALVDATYGGATGDAIGHALYVMVQRDGKWLIRSARINRFPTSAAK